MKRLRTFLLTAVHVFVALAGRNAFAAQAPSADIPLNVPAAFTASAITAVGGGLYCLAGAVYHDDVPNESAMVVLVDTHERRVVWKTDIPYAKDHFDNTALKCVRSGPFFYALTEERTDSVADQSQSEVVLSKISPTGKLLKARRVDVGFDVWSNLLEAGPEGLSLVGGASTDSIDHGGKRSLFLARFDQDLARQQRVVLPTGAFWLGTHAKLEGQSLLIAGQFLSNAGTTAAAHEGYAVSKVDFGKARYVWSTLVYPLATQSEDAVFLPDGSIADIGLSDDHLLVSVVDASGRVVQRFSEPKAICSVDALGAKDSILQAVGKACGSEHGTLMLDIDLAGGHVVSSRQVGDDTTASLFDGDALVSVAAPARGGKVLRRIGR
ncbi:hypothetical protein [Trinickia acidisoli]|uniref:hypothetical protein n=1 Tax=Trinickia acidisoli TaxID=2767482 RepID=UPI001A8E0430|nr:hypothetical protein [Trinickia acidisoli]